ncbi:MAG: MATE family efflux transporter [Pseudomonadota bacterium]
MAAGTDFTQGNLMRQLTTLSFASSIGIVAIYFVDLMDIFFISLLGYKEMAAAASFAGTVMFFISSVNIGFSVASGSLTARFLGVGRGDEANAVTGAATVISGLIAVAMSIAMYPFFPFFLSLLGAEDQVKELGVMYLKIVVPSSFLSAMSMSLVASLRGHGFATWAMYPALFGALVNLVFDPILIFGLDLGLAGAAWATVLARITTFGMVYYITARKFDTVSMPTVKSCFHYLGEIMFYAVPSVLSSVAGPIGVAIITRHVTQFGSEAVAGMAVIGRISPVVFAVVSAMASVVGPMIGQNFSAGLHDRVRGSYFASLKFLAIYVGGLIVVLVLCRNMIADAFSAQGLTRDLILFYCGPFAMIGFFNGVIFATSAAFNNLGRPKLAPRLNWAKNTVGLLLFITIGSYFGIYGMAIGILLNAAVFAGVGHVLTTRIIEQALAAPATDTEEEDTFDEAEHMNVEFGEPTYT